MDDIYARYERGFTCLLKRLETDRDRYIESLLLQSRFNISVAALRTYEEKDPGERANFFRIIKQLHVLCLEIVGMDFDAWCNQCRIEEQEKDDIEHDPLYPYLGDWQALQYGKLQHSLHRELADQGVYINTKRSISVEDPMERYNAVPLHAMLLYTSRDVAVFAYITKNWDFLDALSRDICDIHVSVAQLNGREEASDALAGPSWLETMNIHPLDLPGIVFWDQYDDRAYVSFGRNADDEAMTQIWLRILGDLLTDPTIATIRRVKEMIDQSRHDQDLTSNFDGHRYSQNKLLSLPERLPELKQKDPEVTQQLDGTESSSEPPDSKNDDHNKLVEELRRTPMGDGKAYEELVKKILEYCFTGEFSPFQVRKQVPTNNGKRIRDFIIDNRSPKMEFWQSLKRIRGVEKILFDAKNYKDPVEYAQISSTLRYLKTKAFGNFIIIISRCGVKDYEELLEDYLAEERVVLFLGDADLVKMINLKKEGESPTLLIEEKYHALLDMR